MSIGGDIVSEAIALLQPIKNKFTANIREYCGELDDMAKDTFVLPTYLFIKNGQEGSSVSDHDEVSTVMVEYNGVDHELQDGSNLVYHNTYRVNIWLVVGYTMSTQHKQGGEFLDQADGYGLYDAALDLMAGRRLLKDAETIRFIRGERVYFGNLDATQQAPLILGSDENSATVYKLEFSIKAQSVWERFGGSVSYPSPERGGTREGEETEETPLADEDVRITAVGDPWYLATGPVQEQSGFAVDTEIIINDAYVDFNERCTQQLPNDRVTWRSVFPYIQLPSAIFPGTDKSRHTGAFDSYHRVFDVVDGYPLINTEATQSDILYRRQAAGLYAPDHRGLVRYSPYRALEFTTDEELPFEASTHDGSLPSMILDPYDIEENDPYLTFSGFVVARLTGPGLLMGKYVDEDPSSSSSSSLHFANGWRLSVNASGEVVLALWDAGTNNDWEIKLLDNHLDGQWFGVLFSVSKAGSNNPTVKLYSPHGHFSDSDQFNSTVPPSADSFGGWTCDEEEPVIDAPFRLGGAKGQLAFASYWQGPADPYDVANDINFRYLWRGTINPVNVAENPGFVVTRDKRMVFPVHRPLGGGESVCSFAPDAAVVPHDQYAVQDNIRVLPFDRERQNLLTNSEDFTSWGVAHSIIGPDVTGPNGLLSGFTLASGEIVSQSVSSLDGSAPYVLSIWARSDKQGTIRLNPGTSTDIQLSSKWTRVHSGATGLSNPQTTSITAVGEDIEIWGAQLEEGLLEYDTLNDKYGSKPTAYIPTGSSDSGLVGIDECYVDWTVLPGPLADRGKVQTTLFANADLLGADDDSAFTAFQIQSGDGSGEYIKVFGTLGTITDALDETRQTITWHVVGEVGEVDASIDSPEAVIVEEGQPLTVAVRWHRFGLELWVEGEAVALASGECIFAATPKQCHLMHNVVNASVSSSSNWDDENWMGACKEVRWWR